MADLTVDQLKKILGKAPWEAGANIGGTFYQPVYSSNAQGEAGHGQEGALQQILGYDPTKTDVGQQYSMYGGGGDYQGQGAFKKVKDGDLMAMGLLSAFGMGMLPGAMAGGAGAGGAAGAAPGLAGVAGDAMMPGMLASTGGATVPFGSVIPGLEAWALPASAAGGAAGGAAFNAAADSQLANAAIQAGGGDALAGYAGMAGTSGITGIPGASLLDSISSGAKSLAGGGLGSLGGLATTALGGLLGSKGKQSEASTTNKMDPRFEESIFGDQGILKQLNALKNEQYAQGGLNDLQKLGMQKSRDWLTSPEYSAGFNQMANLGMGMMGRGVASNPFAK